VAGFYRIPPNASIDGHAIRWKLRPEVGMFGLSATRIDRLSSKR
jgi:hypothetical protein